MLLSIHQPNYWPYPGLIGKIMMSDMFVFLTNVQLEKRSWQCRNRIKTANGWNYLSVPIYTRGKYNQVINEVMLNNEEDWRNKHLRAIQLAYKKAPYYNQISDFIEELYSKKWDNLCELDIYIMEHVLTLLGSKTEIFYDTDLPVEGEKNELLIEICNNLGVDQYMSNKGSESYVDISKFNNNNIDHIYINYKGFEYKQIHGEFEDNL